MSETLSITSLETAQFLQEKYGSGIADVTQIGEGGWSLAFAFALEGERHVIRWSDVADNFERDAVAARFSSDVLPVPPIIEIGRGLHSFFAISPFVGGTYLEALSAAEIENTLPSLLKMLRAVRAVDLSDAAGFGFWNKDGKGSHDSWKAFLLDDKNESEGSLIQGWRANLETSSMGMDAYHELWKEFVPLVEHCPEERSLVHSDLINRNVLTSSGTITAVLDWGSSFYGDSLYDVAWFTFYEPWFPQFQEVRISQRLLEDFIADPHANTVDVDARLMCYKLDIGIGSIAYNAFKKDWKNAEVAASYTLRLLG
ncbi:MAG: phosphotransferase family protein [Ktedonobacteraceae bacterium]